MKLTVERSQDDVASPGEQVDKPAPLLGNVLQDVSQERRLAAVPRRMARFWFARA
jgi:hypothetical protein